MKYLFLFCFLLSLANIASAQFHSPALDSNCYFPQIDNPKQMDSIHGGRDQQELGQLIINLGPGPNGGNSRLMLNNLSPTVKPGSQYYAKTGSAFNLHALDTLRMQLPGFDYGYQRGHFRDMRHLDILCNLSGRIYWQDDEGLFDSMRFTDLQYTAAPGFHVSERSDNSYITHLTSDSADDILQTIVTAQTGTISDSLDSMFVCLIKGGASLYSKKLAGQDEEVFLHGWTGNGHDFTRAFSQGEFRGSGEQDLIASDLHDDLFYYHNRRPFDLHDVAHALFYDTLLSWFDNRAIYLYNSGRPNENGMISPNSMVMHALPKPSGDKSVDFVPVIPVNGGSANYNIYFFAGGPDFGKKRLLIDSANYVIRHPALQDPFVFASIGMSGFFSNCGDMTGTGNDVICWGGGSQGSNINLFYVTGKALDEKADMYSYGGGNPDSLTANSDNLTDAILSDPFDNTQADHNKGWSNVGSIYLIYGSKNIPVRLNPKFSNVGAPNVRSEMRTTIKNNPCLDHLTAEVMWPEAELSSYAVTDIAGRQVRYGELRLLKGIQEIKVDLQGLTAGEYNLELRGRTASSGSRFIIAGK